MMDGKLAEVVGEPAEFPNSIFEQIETGWRDRPDKVAVIVMHQAQDHLSDLIGSSLGQPAERNETACLSWTYEQLHKAALKLAIGLMANGVQPGMCIATLIPNRVEYYIVLWMCQLLRLTLCSLDFGATSSPRRQELAKYMTSVRPDIVMVLDGNGADAVDEVLSKDAQAHVLARMILEPQTVPSTGNEWFSISHVVADGLKSAVDPEEVLMSARHDDPNRLAFILFTSGTSTGNPKGCPRMVSSTTFATTVQIFHDSETRWLHSSANFRIIAPSLCMRTWAIGGTIVMQDPTAGSKGTLAAIRDHGVNCILFIPALLHMLVADPTFAQTDVSGVKDTYVGGDMVTRDIFLKLRAAFPKAKSSVGHGMTEGGAIIQWPWHDVPVDKIPYFGEICPLGTVNLGTTLRVRDPETGNTVDRNELGELCISNPSMIRNYLNNQYPEMFFKDDHNRDWFRTGDLGMINDDGVVYILGRLKDVIKRAGIPITPAALESCIEKYTGAQVAVLAYPHPVLGHEPLVVMDSLKGKTVDEIKSHVLGKFSKDYALGPVVTLKDLGMAAFPLNATGKIMKLEILRRAKEEFEK